MLFRCISFVLLGSAATDAFSASKWTQSKKTALHVVGTKGLDDPMLTDYHDFLVQADQTHTPLDSMEVVEAAGYNQWKLLSGKMDRAKDCATHFGKYSLDELRSLEYELHRDDIENDIFGWVTAEDFEHVKVEEAILDQIHFAELHFA